jgi:alpha-1,3-rhamnosyltransferase
MSDQRPLVSAIVPLYNHASYVAQNIRSLIEQSYENMELIVIDDGSTDASFEVVSRMKGECDRRFERVVLVSQDNAGVAATLNRGIEIARGPYLFLLSSDDYVEKTSVDTLLPLVANDDAVCFACGDADFVDDKGRPIIRTRGRQAFTSFVRFHFHGLTGISLPDDFGTYKSFLIGNYIPPGVLLRRSSVREVGGYDTKCAIEDVDLWLKLSKRWRFAFANQTLTHYRWHGKNTALTSRERLRYDELVIFVREAEYCAQNGYYAIWAKAFLERLARFRSAREKLIGGRHNSTSRKMAKSLERAAKVYWARIRAAAQTSTARKP